MQYTEHSSRYYVDLNVFGRNALPHPAMGWYTGDSPPSITSHDIHTHGAAEAAPAVDCLVTCRCKITSQLVWGGDVSMLAITSCVGMWLNHSSPT